MAILVPKFKFKSRELLMATYRDRPMDFAAATLVRLARRERLKSVFNVDDGYCRSAAERRDQFFA